MRRGEQHSFARDRFVSHDFSGRRIERFVVQACRFEGCRFDGSSIDNASFGAGRLMSHYTNCSFDGCRIRFYAAGRCRFVNCSFENADLRDWLCHEVELVDCSFSGRITRAYWEGTLQEQHRRELGRSVNEFHGNDFSRADLVNVGFRNGIDLSRQLLPTGPDYLYIPDLDAAIRHAERVVATWPLDEIRNWAEACLKSMRTDANGGQRDYLFRTGDGAIKSDSYRTATEQLRDALAAGARGQPPARADNR